MTTKPRDYDRCPSCHKLTDKGEVQASEFNKLNPIWDTDFSKPLHELIEEIRHKLAFARGNLSDISAAFPIWKDRTKDVEGLLTCGLVALHKLKEEIRELDERKRRS